MRPQRSRSIRSRSLLATAWFGDGTGKGCGAGVGAGAGADEGVGSGVTAPNPWGIGMDMEGKWGYGEEKECDISGWARMGAVTCPVVGFGCKDDPPGWDGDAGGKEGLEPATAALMAACARRPRRVNGRFANPISWEWCDTSASSGVSTGCQGKGRSRMANVQHTRTSGVSKYVL